MATDEEVNDAVISVSEYVEGNDGDKWLDSLDEAYKDEACKNGEEWDKFRELLGEKVNAASLSSPSEITEVFCMYVEDSQLDKPEVLKNISDRKEELKPQYEQLVEKKKEGEGKSEDEGKKEGEGQEEDGGKSEGGGGASGEGGGKSEDEGKKEDGGKKEGGGGASGEGGDADKKKRREQFAANEGAKGWYTYVAYSYDADKTCGWSGDEGNWDKFKEEFLKRAKETDAAYDLEDMVDDVDAAPEKKGKFLETYGIDIDSINSEHKSKDSKSEDSKSEDSKPEGSRSEDSGSGGMSGLGGSGSESSESEESPV